MAAITARTILFKSVLVLTLFAVFLAIFGYPAFKKYLARGVLVQQDTLYSKEITPPAITVCPRNQATRYGWKQNISTTSGHNWIKEGPCANSTDVEELYTRATFQKKWTEIGYKETPKYIHDFKSAEK